MLISTRSLIWDCMHGMRTRILISGVTSYLILEATYGIYITAAFPMGVPMFRYCTPSQIAANACAESFFVIWTLMVTVGRFLSSSEKKIISSKLCIT
ncbi:hypothetical protein DFP73DRAFT_565362 [Morchella snyderi]|nr:hypothetical protein DFP73DRAFT_565362 [Morchella snyderi]